MGRKPAIWLVFWFPTGKGKAGTTSFVKNAALKAYDRQENKVTYLTFTYANGRREKLKARIVKKGVSQEELKEYDIDDQTGCIIPPDQRAISQVTRDKKKQKAMRKKEDKVALTAVQSSVDSNVLNLQSVVPPDEASMDASVSKPATGNDGLQKSNALTTNSKRKVNTINLSLQEAPNTPTVDRSNEARPSSYATPPSTRVQDALLSSLPSSFVSFDGLISHVEPIISYYSTVATTRFLEDLLKLLATAPEETPHIKVIHHFVSLLAENMSKVVKAKDLEYEDRPCPSEVKLPPHYLYNAPGKVALFPGIAVYVMPSFLNMLDLKMGEQKSWQLYTKVLLPELYGQNLRFLSAKGTRSAKGYRIHNLILQGLLAYAQKEDINVTETSVVTFINSVISNRRGTWKRRIKREVDSEDDNDDTDPKDLGETNLQPPPLQKRKPIQGKSGKGTCGQGGGQKGVAPPPPEDMGDEARSQKPCSTPLLPLTPKHQDMAGKKHDQDQGVDDDSNQPSPSLSTPIRQVTGKCTSREAETKSPPSWHPSTPSRYSDSDEENGDITGFREGEEQSPGTFSPHTPSHHNQSHQDIRAMTGCRENELQTPGIFSPQSPSLHTENYQDMGAVDSYRRNEMQSPGTFSPQSTSPPTQNYQEHHYRQQVQEHSPGFTPPQQASNLAQHYQGLYPAPNVEKDFHHHGLGHSWSSQAPPSFPGFNMADPVHRMFSLLQQSFGYFHHQQAAS